MNWYVKVLSNYATFRGRARRTEYWMFFLFNIIASIILSIVESILSLDELLTGLYSLFIFLPTLAVSARRLHDIGRSAWWLLIALVPLIGFIVLIVFHCMDSEEGENQYGPNPKAGY